MSPATQTRGALAALVLALSSVSACGGTTTPHALGIEEIRRRAQAAPQDPRAQADWAEAELLLPDGDGEAAERAIAHALELRPDEARLTFLRGLERQVHGEPDAALEAFLRTVTLAAERPDDDAAALAEVALALLTELDDGAAGYAPRVRAALEPLFARPGRIGPAAHHAIGSVLAELAYRRGAMDEVRAIARANGCPSEWRVAGPFGPRQLLGFDRALGPEAPGPLEASYDLGPGRGVRATRTLEPRACALHLGGGPVVGAGSTYAEA